MNAIGANPADWNKHFLLIADVNLADYTGTQFKIIGNGTKRFTGVFDGNNHKVWNFTWIYTGGSCIGLFGYVGTGGQIKNLGMENVDVNTVNGIFVGGLAGINLGTITNCYSTGSVSGYDGVGGLVGGNDGGSTITNCYSTGSVSGSDYVGGLTGWNSGTISNCYSTGIITGGYLIGGLVGGNDNNGTITNCYSTGDVNETASGNNYVGGLVGYNEGTITNCYSKGNVSGYLPVGGLVGDGNPNYVTASFWDVNTSGRSNSAGGIGKTTAEMKFASTYISWGSCGNYGVWTIDDGNDYPHLAWEGKPGQLIEQQLSDLIEGNGTQDDPYRVSTAEQLNLIGLFTCEWDKHFILVNDVNLAGYTGTQFNIIGNSTKGFTGVFDGNDHKVWNFTWTSTGKSYIGLFGYVGSGGQIKNLGMENVDVNAVNGSYVGGLVGINVGTITNCYATGSVSGNYYVGGLAGTNDGTVSNCYATGSISGYDVVGGLVGYNQKGTISNCYATGSVSGNYYVGGLVGDNYYGTITNCYANSSVSGNECVSGLVGVNVGGTISNCYSTGNVSGYKQVGGLVGYIKYYGAITNCYSTGRVSGNNSVGGLVGYNQKGTISNCYATGSVSGNYYVGGLVGDNYYGTITNCYSTGSVTGNDEVGGLVGVNDRGTITNCYSTGSVSGNAEYNCFGGLVGLNFGTITNCYSTGCVIGNSSVGGLVGLNFDTITNCYSTGNISGNDTVGGLVGQNGDSEDPMEVRSGYIYNCYSTGAVVGDSNVGGLVGLHIVGEIGASFWDVNTSGQTSSAGGTPKTTAEMKKKSTFTDAGWDFVGETINGTNDYWRMCVDDVNYPLLSWQFAPDFVCPDGVDILDLAFFVERWLAECNEANNFCNCTDINHDDIVNFYDLAILANHWLEGL